MTCTKRQFLLKYGMNFRHFDTLCELGVISVTERNHRVTVLGHNLLEGEHYVSCRKCGAYLAMQTPRHLKACSGISLDDYSLQYPDAPIMSNLCSSHKQKTKEQKVAQSNTLKARFQTPEGR